MTRTRWSGACPDCNRAPSKNADGALTCGCPGKRWHAKLSVQGTEEESANLIRHGFSLAEDAQGNKYYCGPFGHIIFLYENGTWYSDKGDPKLSLQEYLDWMDQRPVV